MRWKVAFLVAMLLTLLVSQPAYAGKIKRFFLVVAMMPVSVAALISKPSRYWLDRLEEAYLQDDYEGYKNADWRR